MSYLREVCMGNIPKMKVLYIGTSKGITHENNNKLIGQSKPTFLCIINLAKAFCQLIHMMKLYIDFMKMNWKRAPLP